MISKVIPNFHNLRLGCTNFS